MTVVEAQRDSRGRVRAARLSGLAGLTSMGMFAVPPNAPLEAVLILGGLLGLVGIVSGICSLLTWQALSVWHRCLAAGGVLAGSCVLVFLGFLTWVIVTFPSV